MNCSEIKMSAFIRWLLNPVERPAEWDDIHSEFVSLRENKSSHFILSLMKEISALETKQFITINCVKVLAAVYREDLVQELKNYGYRGRFNWENKEEYSRDLKSVISQSKRLVTQINAKIKELDTIQQRQEGRGLKQSDFDNWNVNLSRFMGFRVDPQAVTVSEWCVMMNKYDAYVEVENADQNNIIKYQQYGRR